MTPLAVAIQGFLQQDAASSDGSVSPAAALLLRVLGNVLANPKQEKMRRLRKESNMVAKALPAADARVRWVQVLKACGWHADGFEIVLPSDACLFKLEIARTLVWDAISCKSVADSCAAQNLLLGLVLQWVPPLELSAAALASRTFHGLDCRANMPLRHPDGTVMNMAWAQSLAMCARGDGFHAECWPVDPSARNPLDAFAQEVEHGAVAGGDARVSRVDGRTTRGFSRLDFERLLRLPRSHGQVDCRGRLLPVQTWHEVDGGMHFWQAVLTACRLAEWQTAEGTSWTWSERGSIGGRSQILSCQRLMWVFKAQSEAAATDVRWALLCQAVFSTAT
mmetsp:Transcript_26543/g.61980  ORF Transcript_26543/g.61980 Transcript_26543/m.61980 type:complete len:336 (-) Transcript_26543:250-1257(-)